MGKTVYIISRPVSNVDQSLKPDNKSSEPERQRPDNNNSLPSTSNGRNESHRRESPVSTGTTTQVPAETSTPLRAATADKILNPVSNNLNTTSTPSEVQFKEQQTHNSGPPQTGTGNASNSRPLSDFSSTETHYESRVQSHSALGSEPPPLLSRSPGAETSLLTPSGGERRNAGTVESGIVGTPNATAATVANTQPSTVAPTVSLPIQPSNLQATISPQNSQNSNENSPPGTAKSGKSNPNPATTPPKSSSNSPPKQSGPASGTPIPAAEPLSSQPTVVAPGNKGNVTQPSTSKQSLGSPSPKPKQFLDRTAIISICVGCGIAILLVTIGFIVLKTRAKKKRNSMIPDSTKIDDIIQPYKGSTVTSSQSSRSSFYGVPLATGAGPTRNPINYRAHPPDSQIYPAVYPPSRSVNPPPRPPRSPLRPQMQYDPDLYKGNDGSIHRGTERAKWGAEDDYDYRDEYNQQNLDDTYEYLDDYYSQEAPAQRGMDYDHDGRYIQEYRAADAIGVDVMQPDDRPYDRRYTVDRNGRLNQNYQSSSEVADEIVFPSHEDDEYYTRRPHR